MSTLHAASRSIEDESSSAPFLLHQRSPHSRLASKIHGIGYMLASLSACRTIAARPLNQKNKHCKPSICTNISIIPHSCSTHRIKLPNHPFPSSTTSHFLIPDANHIPTHFRTQTSRHSHSNLHISISLILLPISRFRTFCPFQPSKHPEKHMQRTGLRKASQVCQIRN
jgi:hypothetical protein